MRASASWARRIYDLDKVAASICTEMQETGFGFDRAAATLASDALREAEAVAWREAEEAVGRPLRKGNGGGFSTIDLGKAFFHDLHAPVLIRSEKTGAPSLGAEALRAFAAGRSERLAGLAAAVLEWRRARKIRSTYIDAIRVGSDGRVHPSWLNYGTVSGRWSCQAPNLMNLPRKENDPTRKVVPGGIRGLFVPRAGWVIVTFDAKQLEMRMAAYASGDEAMIAACESADLHAANAEIIFQAAFDRTEYLARKEARESAKASGAHLEADAVFDAWDALRSLAKSAGFAVCYLAEAETVYARILASGTRITLPRVKAMLRTLRSGFAGYFRWQDRRLHDAIRTGYVDSPICGRRRWLGHDPSPTECANFPIQGGAADLMNLRFPEIVSALRTRRFCAKVVGQVHDSGVFECPRCEAQDVIEVSKEIFEAPVRIDSSGRVLEASFPIDTEISERWH